MPALIVLVALAVIAIVVLAMNDYLRASGELGGIRS